MLLSSENDINAQIRRIYDFILSAAENESAESIEKIRVSKELFYQLYLSPEFIQKTADKAIDFHLYFIHQARIKMVMTLLPASKVIVDLGGANGSIVDMGYPYAFEKITVIDLPPEDRCEMYKGIQMKPRETANGPIYVSYGSMTDLSIFPDNSVDLVWSGESIEHITEEDSKKVFAEAKRILRKKGHFCLDTPNRLLTEIHTAWRGGDYIHPEHKKEYYPDHLRRNLIDAGFKIAEERGVCEMPNTWKTRNFDYRDFVLGNPLPYNVDSAYIQFYKCIKS